MALFPPAPSFKVLDPKNDGVRGPWGGVAGGYWLVQFAAMCFEFFVRGFRQICGVDVFWYFLTGSPNHFVDWWLQFAPKSWKNNVGRGGGEERRRGGGKCTSFEGRTLTQRQSQNTFFSKFKHKILQLLYADLVLVKGTSFIVPFGKNKRKNKRKIRGIEKI